MSDVSGLPLLLSSPLLHSPLAQSAFQQLHNRRQRCLSSAIKLLWALAMQLGLSITDSGASIEAGSGARSLALPGQPLPLPGRPAAPEASPGTLPGTPQHVLRVSKSPDRTGQCSGPASDINLLVPNTSYPLPLV